VTQSPVAQDPLVAEVAERPVIGEIVLVLRPLLFRDAEKAALAPRLAQQDLGEDAERPLAMVGDPGKAQLLVLLP